MTREEAIAFFKDMNECTYGNLEAVEMAIKALDQEPRWIPEGAKMIEAYWMKGEYPHAGDVICSNCKSCCDALREAHWGKNWKDMETLGWKFHTYYQYCPHCGAKMEDEKVVEEKAHKLGFQKIVTCAECIHGEVYGNNGLMYRCDLYEMAADDDFWCKDGERREG